MLAAIPDNVSRTFRPTEATPIKVPLMDVKSSALQVALIIGNVAAFAYQSSPSKYAEPGASTTPPIVQSISALSVKAAQLSGLLTQQQDKPAPVAELVKDLMELHTEAQAFTLCIMRLSAGGLDGKVFHSTKQSFLQKCKAVGRVDENSFSGVVVATTT